MPLESVRGGFKKALQERGIDPSPYAGRRLALANACQVFSLQKEQILDAINRNLIDAHYDYPNDTIWINALDAAHYRYCITN